MKKAHLPVSPSKYFSRLELFLWCSSVIAIVAGFLIFDGNGYLTLLASLVGVTSLIFNAKGNPIGQALMIAFSLMYGIISFSFSYYGEMLTYLGMTMPMAVFSLIAWLRHPYDGDRSEVSIKKLTKRTVIFTAFSAVAVTAVFYFILKAFGTSNLIPSTVSVTTSYVSVYLTFQRSPYYALGYAANDAVLIILWTLAALEDTSYISVIICFIAFLVNDVYGFINWRAMEKRQTSHKSL